MRGCIIRYFPPRQAGRGAARRGGARGPPPHALGRGPACAGGRWQAVACLGIAATVLYAYRSCAV